MPTAEDTGKPVLLEDGSSIERANLIQISPEPGTTVWDAAIHFQDGFTLMVDRWPKPDPLGRICVPPQRLRIEGYVGDTKMFAAVVNLTGGTKIAPR